MRDQPRSRGGGRKAATDVRTQVLETGADGVDAARRIGARASARAKSLMDKVSRRIGDLPLRRRDDDD